MKKNIIISACLTIALFGVGALVRIYATPVDIQTRVRQIMVECDKFQKNSFVQCIRHSFAHFVQPETVPQVMTAVEVVTTERLGHTGIPSLTCHDVGHIVGDMVSNAHVALPDLIAACGQSCEYGCIHGVVAGRFRKNPTNLTHPDAVCTPQGYLTRKADIKACWHGLGHAFAELGRMIPNASLSYCDRVGGIYEQQECAGGVFMEIFEPPLHNHSAQSSSYDVTSFCAQMPAHYLNFCLMNGAVDTYSRSKNISQAMALCPRSSVDLSHTCAVSVGAAVYDRAEGVNRDVIITCEEAGGLTVGCLEGAVVSSLVADPTAEKANIFCQTASTTRLIWDCRGFVQKMRTDLF